MYLDSSPAAARRSAEPSRRRGDCRQPTRQTAAPTERLRPTTATARRTRLDDAIVSQWLLEQVPAGHRHAVLDDPQPELSA
jgi:hypothetical protein